MIQQDKCYHGGGNKTAQRKKHLTSLMNSGKPLLFSVCGYYNMIQVHVQIKSESIFAKHGFVVVQLLSLATLCNPMGCSTPGFPVLHQLPELLKFMSIELVMLSNHLILCHPLLLLSSIFPIIRVFSNESAVRIRWPKYWSFSFSISPSKEYSELISFKIDCFDLLAFQGTLKSLLQHHSSKASTLKCSAFFMVQLSHP